MKDSKNLVIGILCAVVCVMAVAYAAFTQNLNVNGTATITGRWDVKFTSISCSTSGTAIKNEAGVSETNGLTATVDFTLIAPGDSAYCDLTVTNAGNLPAVFTSITYGAGVTAATLASSPIVITVVQPSTTTLTVSGTSGNAHVWRVQASYDSATTSLDDAVITKNATITLNYQQNLGQS